MPEEFRIRKRKTPAAATTTAATPETEPEPVPPQKLPETYEALGKDNNLYTKSIHWYLLSLVEEANLKLANFTVFIYVKMEGNQSS